MVVRKTNRRNAASGRAKPRARSSDVSKPETRRRAPAMETFPVVGVGASAGGLDAFKKLFSTMPGDCGIAFILIQHLDPTRKSLTAELVGTSTPMRVVQAKHRMRIEPNHVYVIPPNRYLTIHDHTLRLSAPAEPRSLRMAIDYFLRSLAADKGERAIGIVLSGTGTDGTLGLREVKAAGGMTMVQDPETAQHDGMPRSAIASGCADYIVPAEQMADALIGYTRHAPEIEAAAQEPESDTSESLSRTVALLYASTKFDFSGYKKGTLRRRIQRRMSLRHITERSEYLELLRDDPAEAAALFKDLLLKVTSFFRDPAAWQAFQERVIRPLVAAKPDDGTVRVWVPACATGEEAYSLAMVVLEELRAAGSSCRLQVFASDVDTEALDTARGGVYPETIAADVSPERLSQFFSKSEPPIPGEQRAPRRRGFCATESHRRPAVLQARRDQLSQSSHLSRAGVAGPTSDLAAFCAWRRRLPLPGQRRGHRPPRGPIRGDFEEVARIPSDRPDPARQGSVSGGSRTDRARRVRRNTGPAARSALAGARSTVPSQALRARLRDHQSRRRDHLFSRADRRVLHAADGSAHEERHREGARRAASQPAWRHSGVLALRPACRPLRCPHAPRHRAAQGDDHGRAPRCHRQPRGAVVGLLREPAGAGCVRLGRRPRQRRRRHRRCRARERSGIRAHDHQERSPADDRGLQGSERRADVGQRRAPIEQRGVGDIERGAPIAQRRARDLQQRAREPRSGSWRQPTTISTTC